MLFYQTADLNTSYKTYKNISLLILSTVMNQNGESQRGFWLSLGTMSNSVEQWESWLWLSLWKAFSLWWTELPFFIFWVHTCINNLGTTGWMNNKSLEKTGSKIMYFRAPSLSERCCLQKQFLFLKSPEIRYCCVTVLPSDPFYPPCSEENLFKVLRSTWMSSHV